MQKRSEINKEAKKTFIIKFRNMVMIVFCMMFAFSTIYAVDVSTNRLINLGDGSYAIRVVKTENRLLRVDLVGKQYYLDLKRVELQLSKAAQKAKDLFIELQNRFN